jgi:hypothetical protein
MKVFRSRLRLAEPRRARAAHPRPPAQMAYRPAAASLRTGDHAAGLRHRPRLPDGQPDLGRPAGRLPDLPGSRHPRLHRLHDRLLPVAVLVPTSACISRNRGRASSPPRCASSTWCGAKRSGRRPWRPPTRPWSAWCWSASAGRLAASALAVAAAQPAPALPRRAGLLIDRVCCSSPSSRAWTTWACPSSWSSCPSALPAAPTSRCPTCRCSLPPSSRSIPLITSPKACAGCWSPAGRAWHLGEAAGLVPGGAAHHHAHRHAPAAQAGIRRRLIAAIRLADAPVNKFSSFPIHSLEGAIKYIKCRTSIGCGPLTCVCEHRDGKLRIAWTEDKGMERSS